MLSEHPQLKIESGSADSLVIEVLPLAVDLVLQGEVKGDVLHLLLDEDLGARGVLLFLQVFDHVGEPHGQTIVAAGEEEEVEGKELEDGEQESSECNADAQRCLRRRLISGATINLTMPFTVSKDEHQILSTTILPEGHGEPHCHHHVGGAAVLR